MEQQTAVFVGNLLLLLGLLPIALLGFGNIPLIEPIRVPILHSILLLLGGGFVIGAGIFSSYTARHTLRVLGLLMIGEMIGAVALQGGMNGAYWSDIALSAHVILAVWILFLSLSPQTHQEILLSPEA